MRIIKCPDCKNDIMLTEKFVQSPQCPYCHEHIHDPLALPSVDEEEQVELRSETPNKSMNTLLIALSVLGIIYYLISNLTIVVKIQPVL